MYIKANQAYSKLVSSFSHHSSIYSSSLLSYFYSASSERSSGASSRQELIYNEPSSSTRSTPIPPTPPPPPLPKRNSIIYPSPDAEHSLTYGPENNSPHLRINIHARSSATLESKKSKQVPRRPSLPPRLITHELNHARETPHSESESLVIESTQYVRDIQKRRDNIHATLLRDTNPGQRLRRMLGYRIEQRLVKVLSSRKSRSNTKKRPQKKKKRNSPNDNRQSKLSYKKSNQFQRFFSSPGLFRKLTRKFVRRKHLKNYILDYVDDYDDDNLPSDIEGLSRSPTPRFIVDRQGAFRWPPIRIGEVSAAEDDNSIQPVIEHSDRPSANLGIENFTLKKPSTQTSSDAPCVLGWLQVTK